MEILASLTFSHLVTGTIDYNKSIKTASSVTRLTVPNPILNIYNTRNQNFKQINQMIWDSGDPATYHDDTTDHVAGSYSPVTVDVASSSNYLDITLVVGDDLKGVPFHFRANFEHDKDVFSNPSILYFTSVGTKLIRVAIHPSWAVQNLPWGIAGDVTWTLSIAPTSQIIPITTTRVEIYGLTNSLPAFYNNGIDVRLPRILVLPTRNGSAEEWVAYVIAALHGKDGITKFQYDTLYGRAFFGVSASGGDFDLRSWVDAPKSNRIVNCYDQAAILQIALGLVVPGTSTWLFLQPFGYIKTTRLVGIHEDCNNPFYRSNGTKPLVDRNDAKRTIFGNHAFIEIPSKNDKIGDACTQPHLASEDRAEFIKASTQQAGTGDDETTLYKGLEPGTVDQISDDLPGVVSLNKGPMTSTALEKVLRRLQRPDSLVETAAVSSGHSLLPCINLDLPVFHELVSQRSGYEVLDHHQQVSAGGSFLQWILGSSSDPITIEIAVLSDMDHAELYFAHELTKYQRPLEEVLGPPPPGMEKGHLCLTSSVESTDHALMLWARGNVVVHVSTPTTLHELHMRYGRPIDQILQSGSCTVEELAKPVLRGLQGPSDNLVVGQEFSVHAWVSI